MINVLITGSNGFLGRSLKCQLALDPSIRALDFCRGDSDELLNEYLALADFIFHFAGEVRPDSSDASFESSNLGLTKKMIELLYKNGKKTPILFTSTIHAIEPKNSYGKTKRESEEVIESYCRKNSVYACVYRLPHVFGPGCKPNYNSIITTWIYNSINDLEIKVFNREIEMHYCYSIDLVEDFIKHLKGMSNTGCVFIKPKKVYETTLGQVVDLIRSFRESQGSVILAIPDDSFKQKLYNTYQFYLKK